MLLPLQAMMLSANPAGAGQLEYGFVVAHGADPKVIQLAVVGAGLAQWGAASSAPRDRRER